MIEHINTIDCLHMQIAALLDLMQCCNEDCIDIKSIQTASEMCQTMLDEIITEVYKIREESEGKNGNQDRT